MPFPLLAVFGPIVKGVQGYFERKQKVQNAITENKCRLALDKSSNNHEWEMKVLTNSGWKDDVLFYGIVAMYVYSAIDPEGAGRVFKNWELIPEWFRTITFWLVASVIGVKKLGDYVPGAIRGVRDSLLGK